MSNAGSRTFNLTLEFAGIYSSSILCVPRARPQVEAWSQVETWSHDFPGALPGKSVLIFHCCFEHVLRA